MLEQMCGASGPGTAVWETHTEQLVGERNNIERSKEVLNNENNECNIQDQVSRTDRLLSNQILIDGVPIGSQSPEVMTLESFFGHYVH